jgi:hypothetical protein
MKYSGAAAAGRCFVIAAFVLHFVMGNVGAAQEHPAGRLDVLRSQLGLEKRNVVEANLVLTKAEADAFWPIYDDYQAELAVLHERLVAVSRAYAAEYDAGTITDARAVELLDEAIAIDEAEIDLRKRTTQRLKTAIPGIEAARYLQIENRIHLAAKLELAEEIPLVE